MNDKEIVKMLFERSEDAISQIEQKYGAKCRKIAMSILNNEQDAEECLNDAYLNVWQSIPPETPQFFFAFLFRVVRNISLKKHRTNIAAKRCSYYEDALEEMDAFLASGESVETEIENEEFNRAMETFLDSLNEENRVVFVRRYWYLESCKEIAKKLGTTEKNITVRLSRTREKLRKYLEERGFKI